MAEVIKRDKKKEPFDESKIRRSIENAARDAKLSDERTKELVDQVLEIFVKKSEKEAEIETNTIREAILKQLDTLEPAVSEAWRKFDQAKPSRR